MSSPAAASPLRDRADWTGRPRRLSSRVPTASVGPGPNLTLTGKAPDIARSDPPVCAAAEAMSAGCGDMHIRVFWVLPGGVNSAPGSLLPELGVWPRACLWADGRARWSCGAAITGRRGCGMAVLWCRCGWLRCSQPRAA
jgi:hypothetical protein